MTLKYNTSAFLIIMCFSGVLFQESAAQLLYMLLYLILVFSCLEIGGHLLSMSSKCACSLITSVEKSHRILLDHSQKQG